MNLLLIRPFLNHPHHPNAFRVIFSMAKILIIYASKKGSTAEIAQAIAKELQTLGHHADVTDIATIPSPAGYAAVVIGGPMYMGHIDSRVGKFTKRYAGELAKLPVAGFVVCLAAASKDPEGMVWAEKALKKALTPVLPVAETIFAGKLDLENLSWLERWMIKKVNSPVGDFRDWAAIASWTRELPGKMNV
jgi:menaquinone-dependent protoporphyrinogen oxidase